jgi:uncharacterized membrane protein YdcZ (DUF606 family)
MIGSFELRKCGFTGGSQLDGCFDAVISATPAEITLHSLVNFLVGWIGLLFQQCRRGHDLSGLTITTLWHYQFFPGLLYGVIALLRKAFNGSNS